MITLALIRDTFREALARRIFLGLFAMATLTILFLLFLLHIDIVEGATATVSLLGSSSSREIAPDELVRRTLGGIQGFIYTVGMFLAVFASAGLVPTLLEPGRIELLLSKPVSRTHILLGRYLGNLLLVALLLIYLMTSVWIIMGSKTGVWSLGFLLGIPITIIAFASLLSVIVLVGVLSESSAVAIMVTVGLMILSPILAAKDTATRLLTSEWSRELWSLLYWILPKIYGTAQLAFTLVRGRPVETWEALWTSTLFAVAVLAIALAYFEKRDF